MFRLEIKSDKRKNSAGKRNDVTRHVKYINREGPYKNIDAFEQIQSLEYLPNTIVGQELILPAPDEEKVIYSSPFGIIKFDKDGLHLSEKASPETVAIALSLAEYLYKGKVDVAGNEEFKQKVLSVTTIFQYNTTFNSSKMQETITQLRKDEDNGRREWNDERRRRYAGSGNAGNGFVRSDGRIRIQNRIGRGWRKLEDGTSRFIPGDIKSDATEYSTGTSTGRGLRVPTLSTLPLVPERYRYGSRASGNMQRRTVPGVCDILDRRSEAYGIMRWTVPAKRRVEVERVTKTLISNFQKQVNEDFSQAHVQYINRDKAFKVRGGCLYTSHHLPAWAENSAEKFFSAADTYERRNAEHYKEIVLALPNELDLETHIGIIEKFISQHCYYTYAIHDKIGSLSNGERQPHVHIMFSTRKIDKIERTHERTPEDFFSRYNPNEPEKGGCKKDSRWNDKYRYAYLATMRENAARLINDALKENGINVSVSHKSLKAQAAEARAQGNLYLAEMLSRMPQQHIDTMDVLAGEDKSVKQVRRFIYEYTQSIHEKNIFNDIVKHESIENRILELDKTYKYLFEKIQDTDLTEREQGYFNALQDELDRLQNDIQIQKTIPLWGSQVLDKALSDFMNKWERENWQDIKRLGKQKKEWEQFRKELFLQNQSDENVSNALAALDAHLKSIDDSLREKAIISRRTFKRLNKDSKREYIKMHASKILFENSFSKERLAKIVEQYRRSIDKLIEFRNSLVQKEVAPEKDEQIYTAEELQNEANRSVEEIKKDISAAIKKRDYLRTRVISHIRAIPMAENVYTKGALKEIRKKIRDVEKAIIKLPEHQSRQSLVLELESLKTENKRLYNICSTPKARQKINLIASGIMLKNQPTVKEYENIKIKVDNLFKELAEAKKVQNTLAKKTNSGSRYKISNSPTPHSLSFPAQVAAALEGNVHWAVLIAESKKDSRLGDWKFLSELEKEELLAEMAEK